MYSTPDPGSVYMAVTLSSGDASEPGHVTATGWMEPAGALVGSVSIHRWLSAVATSTMEPLGVPNTMAHRSEHSNNAHTEKRKVSKLGKELLCDLVPRAASRKRVGIDLPIRHTQGQAQVGTIPLHCLDSCLQST